MNHSTVSGCGEIEHSENSRKSGQQKNPTARKQLEISIKRTLKIGHCLCRFCAIQQRKKAAAISLPQLFGGSWWIRKPRSKKQSAGLFFAVCGRPTCSNPTSSTKQEKSEPVSDWRRVRIFRFLRVQQRRLPWTAQNSDTLS